MKILLVAYRFDAAGGLEIVSAGLAKALAAIGHSVKCAAVNGGDSLQSDGYEVIGLAPRNRWMRSLHVRWPTVTRGGTLRRMLEWCDAVIVCHCHLLPFVQQCLPAGESRPRIAAWLHGREVWGAFANAYRAALQRTDLLVAVSKYTSDTVAKSLGERYRPIVIPNPVDTEIFHPLAEDAGVNRFTLFTVGRHDTDTQHKGYDLVLEAMALLRKTDRDLPITLAIGGSGPRLPALQQHSAQLGLADQVRWVGKLSRSELVRQYSSADLFVFPSRVVSIGDGVWGEGFGVVNIEAAACGRPVLTSTHGGCPETIQDGQTGVLVDPTSPQAIADGISTIFRRAAGDRDAMGRRGRAFVVEQFSYPAYSRRLVSLLETLSNQTAGKTKAPWPR